MKYSEIKDLQFAELNKRLDQNKQALFNARMKHKMQRLSNSMELRDLKKDIARLQTALSILPESAFVSEKKETVQKEPKKTVEVKKAAKAKEVEKPVTTDKPSAEKIKKPVEVAAKGKDSDKSQKDSKVQRSEKQKKWFSFLGGKSASGKSGKSAPGKRKLFRRKSG